MVQSPSSCNSSAAAYVYSYTLASTFVYAMDNGINDNSNRNNNRPHNTWPPALECTAAPLPLTHVVAWSQPSRRCKREKWRLRSKVLMFW